MIAWTSLRVKGVVLCGSGAAVSVPGSSPCRSAGGASWFRRRRRGRTASTMHRRVAMAEATSARFIFDCGTQRRAMRTVAPGADPVDRLTPRSASWVLVMCQPLAYPSTSSGAPRSTDFAFPARPVVAVALQPALMLSPRTTSNGPVTCRATSDALVVSRVTIVVGVAPAGVAGISPATGSAPAAPPGAESSVTWSMFQPVVVWWPSAVSMTCAPADSEMPASEFPHGAMDSGRSLRASAVVPEIWRSTG